MQNLQVRYDHTAEQEATGSMAYKPRQLYVNGAWVAPAAGGTMPVINPATEQQIGVIPGVRHGVRAYLKGGPYGTAHMMEVALFCYCWA